MSPKNLWGEIPSADEIRPPAAILKEQASVLSELTNGVLYGDVTVSRDGSTFTLELSIVAPALDGYQYSVLQVVHNVRMYPLTVTRPLARLRRDEQPIECADEEEYERALTTILSSKSIRTIIASLIAQSRAV